MAIVKEDRIKYKQLIVL